MAEDDVVRARDLRVSDAEREHVAGLLQRAVGRGLLTLDEFTERTDIALAARTRGELNAVLIDLPGVRHPDSWVRPAEPAGPSDPPRPPLNRLELKAHGSALVRKGRWTVPRNLVVRNKYGSTKLDLTEAQINDAVVDIELDTKWSSVEVIIPDRAAIDVNSITEVKWGSLDDKTDSNGKSGTPRIVLSGRVHGGALVIRYPKRGLFG